MNDPSALFFRLAGFTWYVYMLGVSVLTALWVRQRWFVDQAATPNGGKDAAAIAVLGVLVVAGVVARVVFARLRARALHRS